MATNSNERMVSRQARVDYLLLNDGYDDETLPEDYISETAQSGTTQLQPEIKSFSNIPSSEILPSESASQIIHSPIPTSSFSSVLPPRSQKRWRPAPVTSWLWDHFEVTEVDRPWIIKKTKKRELVDRDIQCAYIDSKSGKQCSWKTSDSQRQTSSTNMQRHLEKHSIFSPHHQNSKTVQKEHASIISLLTKKESLTLFQNSYVDIFGIS